MRPGATTGDGTITPPGPPGPRLLGGGRMMEFGKLVPQMIFDIFTRFVPGAVLLCSWTS
jgi:hypothetical protein